MEKDRALVAAADRRSLADVRRILSKTTICPATLDAALLAAVFPSNAMREGMRRPACHDVVRELLAAGADPRVDDDRIMRAALAHGWDDAYVALLLAHGAVIDESVIARSGLPHTKKLERVQALLRDRIRRARDALAGGDAARALGILDE